MRALIFELHPTLLDTHGLVARSGSRRRGSPPRGGPAVTVDGPEERLDIAAEAELDVYRLTQEALHNCVKHARASARPGADRPAADNPGTLLVEVADDGVGFDPAPAAPGLGLVSMRERAERLGGQLVVAARAGGGTVVRLVAPGVLGGPGGSRRRGHRSGSSWSTTTRSCGWACGRSSAPHPGVELVGEAPTAHRARAARRARRPRRAAGRRADGPRHARARTGSRRRR